MGEVTYNQSGYIGKTRSWRAEMAEEEGLLPWSRITSKSLKNCGITYSKKFLSWLRDHAYISSTEWHHVGKFAAETDYWDCNDIKKQLDTIDKKDMDSYLEKYKEFNNQKSALKNSDNPHIGRKVLVTYTKQVGKDYRKRQTYKDVPGIYDSVQNRIWLDKKHWIKWGGYAFESMTPVD